MVGSGRSNRTIVGLKQVFQVEETNDEFCSNRTIVGLKLYNAGAFSDGWRGSNRTIVGLKPSQISPLAAASLVAIAP